MTERGENRRHSRKGKRIMIYYSIDFNSDEAIYIQLKNQIILRIAGEELHNGDNLPSVRDMAESIGINMHTVNKTYAVLKQEGYLSLDRRRGAVVSLDYDKLRDIEEMKQRLRVILASAICKNISEEEIHEAMTEVMGEFRV